MNLADLHDQVVALYGEQVLVTEDQTGEVTISTGFEVDPEGNLVKMAGL